jgi:hypothetical protein
LEASLKKATLAATPYRFAFPAEDEAGLASYTPLVTSIGSRTRPATSVRGLLPIVSSDCGWVEAGRFNYAA